MLFKKTTQAQTPVCSSLQRDLRRLTADLIMRANRAEAEATPNNGVEVTHAGEVFAARELIAAQNELLRAISAARCRGIQVDQIRREIIEPTIDTAVVGDMAWTMLTTVLESAMSREHGNGAGPGYRHAASF